MSIFENFYYLLRDFFLLQDSGSYFEFYGAEIAISFASLVFSLFTIVFPFVVAYFVGNSILKLSNRWL